MKRDKPVQFMVTPEEHTWLLAQAGKAGKTLSAYCRGLILHEAPSVVHEDASPQGKVHEGSLMTLAEVKAARKRNLF